MENNMHAQTRGIALRFLKWFCPDHLYEEIEGDLVQKYNRDVKQIGERKAKRRLFFNSLLFFRPGIFMRNGSPNLLTGSQTGDLSFLETVTFKRINGVGGWLVFAIALVTYSLTVEETASYWDCAEFIAASDKLQVPHPPGAPLFLLMGRMFSFFAMNDVTQIAYAINMMSVIASAFTILLLFWSIVLLGRKLMPSSGGLEEGKWLLIGAGGVGALAYAFSDSFWFSAVEAEVYAFSSLSTALVVWGILKWDETEDIGHANRWLILIAYVIGLSIGIHLLNLLTLPALALVYYFKKFKPTPWGIVAALCMGGASVLFINQLIILGLPTLAGRFELFFVNGLGLSFGSGAAVFILLLAMLLSYGIWITHKRHHASANTLILAITFIIIGYGSYATIVIRSDYDPPINENAPKDAMSFVRYLRREQYGTWPILYGPYFTSNPTSVRYGAANYIKGRDKYEIGERSLDVTYDRGDETILPRAWNPDHKDEYERIMGLKAGERPTFIKNLSYMISHQFGTMYGRYFMWNFAGRMGEEIGADWLRPAAWFKNLPPSVAPDKARNNFFMIPFLLGLLGMGHQYFKDTKGFSVLMLLFLMLGAAIVLYLNSPPSEPRERDYIYVGSYFAFSLWIGLGVMGLADALSRVVRGKRTAVIAASLLGMTAPALMIFEGWDDHDRSNRFFSVDAATNTLNSCDPNGIVFTGGDNDTFPLWYAQETEDCRQDLRVLVSSYCNTDWYIDQTTRLSYQSQPFHYTLDARQYRQGGPNDYLRYANLHIPSIDARQYLNLLAKEYPALRNGDHNVVPSKMIILNIDKEAILKKGIVPEGMEHLVVDQMELRLTGDVLEKKDLMFLDILVTNDWERPVYLNPTSLSQMNLDMQPYAVMEGNVYRILPIKNPRPDRSYLVNTDKSYDLMIHKFRYRGLADKDVYYTNDYRMQVLQHRTNLNSLAEALVDKGEIGKAAQVLDFLFEKMPDTSIPYDPSVPDSVQLLFKVGRRQKAVDIATAVGNKAREAASYRIMEERGISFELRKNLFLLGAMQRTLFENDEEMLAKEFEASYEKLISALEHRNSAGE